MSAFSTINPYLRLMRLHKPIGSLLLLWPTLWALWVAQRGVPSLKLLLVFVLGVVLMRSAGCVINDYADRKIDGQVKRTATRPLASSLVTPTAAIVLFAVLCCAAAGLLFFLNTLSWLLALCAVLFATVYPFTKRFFVMPQLVLALAYSFSILMAFSAVTSTLPPVAWILFLANIAWTIAYDTEYALGDKQEDLKIGVHSSAILFGKYEQVWTIMFQLLFLAFLAGLGCLLGLNLFYWLALMAVGVLFFYQNLLIFKQTPERCLSAFLNNNWVGALVFLGIALQSPLRMS